MLHYEVRVVLWLIAPRPTIYNIISKEKGNAISQEDFSELLSATKNLSISLDRFTAALEKVQTATQDTQDSVPEATYSATAAGIPKKEVIELPSKFRNFNSDPYLSVKSRFGFSVNDIVKVENDLISEGYRIPNEFKFGTVTRFTKRFVFFKIKYQRGNYWYCYEAWRASHNLSLIRSS